jgi:glycosyltransferase 2 family protein
MIPSLTNLLNAIKRRKRSISILFGVAFLALIVYYIIKNFHEFSALRITSVWLLLVIFIAVLVRNFSTGLVMDTVLRPLGVHLRIVESFGLANLTRLVNQLLPGNVGIVMRSVYLKRRHRLSYASFTSSFAASQIILYLISSALGIVAFFITYLEGSRLNILFLYFLIAAVLGLSSLLFIPRRWSTRIKHNRLRKAIEGWYQIRTDARCLGRLTVWSLLFIVSSTVIMYANFSALDAPISPWMALFFSSINIVNTLVAFTPAGIGVSEGVIVLLATAAGIPVTVGLAAALLQRIITFFAVILVAPYFSYKLFNLSPVQLLRGRFDKEKLSSD